MWIVKNNDIYCNKCNTRVHAILQGVSKVEHVCDCGDVYLPSREYWDIMNIVKIKWFEENCR